MKRTMTVYAILVHAIAVAAVAAWVVAGSLTPPPGPIGPTVRTLDEVRPVTLLRPSAMPITIDTPGAYALAASGEVDATTLVTVTVPGVHIDLGGHTLRAKQNYLFGAIIACTEDVTELSVRNGTVGGAGGGAGVACSAASVVLEDVDSVDNNRGAVVGPGSAIRRCRFARNAYSGLEAGDGSLVSEVIAIDNSSAAGSCGVLSGGIIRDSIIANNGSYGLCVHPSGRVSGNYVAANAGHGLLGGTGSLVRDNVVSGGADPSYASLVGIGAGSPASEPFAGRIYASNNIITGYGAGMTLGSNGVAAENFAENGVSALGAGVVIVRNFADDSDYPSGPGVGTIEGPTYNTYDTGDPNPNPWTNFRIHSTP